MDHYLEFGDPGGFPVVYCHGTPGSAEEGHLANAAALRHGLHLIAFDRPGYGWTEPALDLSYAAWGQRAAREINELGITRYGILGVSGGGPNALALAAADAMRIAAISLVCPLGPFVEAELARSANLAARTLLRIAYCNLSLLDWLALRPLAFLGRTSPHAALAFLSMINARPDRRALARPEIMRMMRQMRQRTFRQGSAGFLRDLRLMTQPWDFALSDISASVSIWHGERDALLLPAHSHWLVQRLPHATLKLIPGEGHLSLPLDHTETIVRELAARCLPGMK